jgi:hypothetical protein
MTITDTKTILDACSSVVGITCADLARALGCKRNTMARRLTRLQKQGRLTMVQRFNGGSPRWFSNPVFAKEAQQLNLMLATGRMKTRPSAAAEAVVPDAVQVQVITRTGSVEHIDRMAGQAPRDDAFVARQGSMDFKSIPSLSPFRTGAVR